MQLVATHDGLATTLRDDGPRRYDEGSTPYALRKARAKLLRLA
jgi:hypothetical protein